VVVVDPRLDVGLVGAEQLPGRTVAVRIPAIPYTQSGVFVHPGPTWVSEAA